MLSSKICLNSIGIDIGTTTTQVIFSRLQVANTLPQQLAPRLEIVDRQILYRGEIYFTPLSDPFTIDPRGIRALVNREFRQAELKKADIHTGAVIITGQSAKKNNAEEIAHSLADITGNFVVVTAGPHIEATLAGKGSGAAARSKKKGTIIANIDIGGGTSNISVFDHGALIDSCCLNIGGRLLTVNPDGIVTGISEELNLFFEILDLDIRPTAPVTMQQLQRLTDALAATIRYAFAEPVNEHVKLFLATEGLRLNYPIDEIIFSGGVADFIYQPATPQSIPEISCYGDIGPLLGAAVRDAFKQFPARLNKPVETIRATVTGAGIQSLRLSGSTILINRNLLPLKNIPVLKINDLLDHKSIIRSITTLVSETGPAGLAFALNQIALSSFADIYRAAVQIKIILGTLQMKSLPFIIITENDCALALGQTIGTLTNSSKIMCIDQVVVDEGDYIDIGLPIEDKAVPVVIKTLLF